MNNVTSLNFIQIGKIIIFNYIEFISGLSILRKKALNSPFFLLTDTKNMIK